MFDTFSSDDLLRGNKWKGQELPPEVLSTLKEQADQLKDSLLWKVLKAELQWFALTSLMEKGETAEDLRHAKLFGTLVQELDKKIRNF